VGPEDIFERFNDHEAFCRESLTVRTEQGAVVPLDLGPAQLRLDEAIRKQCERGKPVRIVYLKARRVRVSTATAAQNFHKTPFHTGQHTAVVAHDEETALNLFRYYDHFAKEYKPFGGVIGLPRLRKSAEGKLEWANDSWVHVATARNVNFGRSFNLRRVHFSEFAFYLNATALMVSVMQAVPNDADTMVVVESTANGVGNEFHKLWLRANDPLNPSDWIAVFFAWWEHPDYSLPLEEEAGRFEASLDNEERDLKKQYNLTLEQLNWRRWCIENNLAGDKAKFRQEYPSCPEEAFLASGRLRFDVQCINRLPVQRDAAQGGLEVNSVGLEKRISFVPRERGELTVFRRPERGRLYVMGADSAEGIDANEGKGEVDPDFSVGDVYDRDTGEEVAVLRGRLTPSAFGQYLYWLGIYYNWAGIVPEVNSIGVATVDEMLRLGYPPGLIYHRLKQPDEDPAQRADLIGWKTTTVTRQQLLSKLDTALRERALHIHSPITVQELMTFVIWPDGKARAQKGCHDDTVIAAALAVVGIEQLPRWSPPGTRAAPTVEKYGRRGEVEARGTRLRF
jgi:hypothetical protein